MNGDLGKAEAFHREALLIMERTLGPGDPQIAEVLFNLSAVVGAQKGRLAETEVLLHRCLEAQKQLHGDGELLELPWALNVLLLLAIAFRRVHVKNNVRGPTTSAVTSTKTEQNVKGLPAATEALSTSGKNMNGPPAGNKTTKGPPAGTEVLSTSNFITAVLCISILWDTPGTKPCTCRTDR